MRRRSSRKHGRVRINRRKPRALNWNFLGVVLMLTLFGIAHLLQRTEMKRMIRQMNDLQRQVEDLVQENRRLQIRMIELSSASRIEKIAREKLGMVPLRRPPTVLKLPSVDRERREPPEWAAANKPARDLALLNPQVLIGQLEK